MKPLTILNKGYYRRHVFKLMQKLAAYFFCVLLIVTIGFTASSFSSYVKEERMRANGTQDAVLINADTAKLKAKIKDFESGNTVEIATHKVGGALYNNVLKLGYMDDAALDIHHIKLSEGRMPKGADELALEKHAFLVLRKRYKPGEKINLTLEPSGGGEAKSFSFTLTGVIENFSDLQWKIKNTDSLFPSALVSEEFLNKSGIKSGTRILALRLKNSADAPSLINEDLLREGICDNFFTNKNEATNKDTEDLSVYAINTFLVVGCLLAVITLFNIYLMTFRTRKKEIGLYRAAGMTGNDITACLVLRELPIVAAAIVLGCFPGYYLAGYIMPKLDRQLSFVYDARVIPSAAAVLCLLSVLAVVSDVARCQKITVVQDITEFKKHAGQKDVKVNFKNPVVLWSVKSYLFSKGTALTLSILVMVCVFANTAGSSLVSFYDYLISNSYLADIRIDVYNGVADLTGMWMDPLYGIAPKDCEYILQSPDIASYKAFQVLPIAIRNTAAEAKNDESENKNTGSPEYKAKMREYGYKENDVLSGMLMSVVDDKEIEKIKKSFDIEGKIDIEAMNAGKEVIYVYCPESDLWRQKKYNVGDKIVFSHIYNGKKVEFETKVGVVAHVNEEKYGRNMESLAHFGNFICKEDFIRSLGLEKKINEVYLNIKDTNNVGDLDMRLNAVASAYERENEKMLKENIYVYGARSFRVDQKFQETERNKSFRQTLNVAYKCIYIAVLAFVVVCTAVLQNIKMQERKKVLAAMSALGLTKKNVFFMVFTENLCQFAVGSFFGALFSGGVILLKLSQVAFYNVISFPVLRFLGLMGILFSVLVLVSLVSTNRFYKTTDIASALSSEQ